MKILRVRYKEAAGEAAWGRRATINANQYSEALHNILTEEQFAEHGEQVIRGKEPKVHPKAEADPKIDTPPAGTAGEATGQPAGTPAAGATETGEPQGEEVLPKAPINITMLPPTDAARVVSNTKDLPTLKAYAKLEGSNPKAPGGREKVMAAIQKRREALNPGKE